jgi:hypothetical protein
MTTPHTLTHLHPTQEYTRQPPQKMVDDEEYVQLTISEAFVYKVPPRTSAQGHKCVSCSSLLFSLGFLFHPPRLPSEQNAKIYPNPSITHTHSRHCPHTPPTQFPISYPLFPPPSEPPIGKIKSQL